MLGTFGPRFSLGCLRERLAKRHGAVALEGRKEAEETPEEVLAWMARSLRLAEPGESPGLDEMLARFDPELPPKEPTAWEPDW